MLNASKPLIPGPQMTTSNSAPVASPSLTSGDVAFWTATADRLVTIVRWEAGKEKCDGICAVGVMALIDAMGADWHAQFYEGRDLTAAVTDLRDVASVLERIADGVIVARDKLAAENQTTSFLELLAQADSVTAHSPVLDKWETMPVTGDPANEVVIFSWEDAEGEYSCTLTEGGIAAGQWKNGVFICNDSQDCQTIVRMYSQKLISPGAPACVDLAADDIDEILVQTMKNLGAEKGMSPQDLSPDIVRHKTLRLAFARAVRAATPS